MFHRRSQCCSDAMPESSFKCSGTVIGSWDAWGSEKDAWGWEMGASLMSPKYGCQELSPIDLIRYSVEGSLSAGQIPQKVTLYNQAESAKWANYTSAVHPHGPQFTQHLSLRFQPAEKLYTVTPCSFCLLRARLVIHAINLISQKNEEHKGKHTNKQMVAITKGVRWSQCCSDATPENSFKSDDFQNMVKMTIRAHSGMN